MPQGVRLAIVTYEPWSPRLDVKAGFAEFTWALLCHPVLETMYKFSERCHTNGPYHSAEPVILCTYWSWQDGTWHQCRPCFWNSCQKKIRQAFFKPHARYSKSIGKVETIFNSFWITLNMHCLILSNKRLGGYSIHCSNFSNTRTPLQN